MTDNTRKWCAYGGEAYAGKHLAELRRPDESEYRQVVCPGCGRVVKLRRHPSSGGIYMQIPRHYEPEEE